MLTCISRAFTGSPRVSVMASFDSAVLASFVAQVRGIMFYDLAVSGAGWGDSVHLVRAPYNRYDSNCLDVRCASGIKALPVGSQGAGALAGVDCCGWF